jgi:hypothetical protein
MDHQAETGNRSKGAAKRRQCCIEHIGSKIETVNKGKKHPFRFLLWESDKKYPFLKTNYTKTKKNNYTHFLKKKKKRKKTQIEIEPCRDDQLLKIQAFQGKKKKLKPRNPSFRYVTEKPRFKIEN